MVYIRQHQSSPLSAMDIENYVNDMGDHRFQDSTSQSSAGPLKYKDKVRVTVQFYINFFCFGRKQNLILRSYSISQIFITF